MKTKRGTIVLHADGGARGNPGPAGAGAVVYAPNGDIVAEVSDFLGKRTNNWAEYEALIQGLLSVQKHFGNGKEVSQRVEVNLDSELIVRQMNGEYKVKNPELKKQYERVKSILNSFSSVSFAHVRRENNAVADKLANDAMDRGV